MQPHLHPFSPLRPVGACVLVAPLRQDPRPLAQALLLPLGAPARRHLALAHLGPRAPAAAQGAVRPLGPLREEGAALQ